MAYERYGFFDSTVNDERAYTEVDMSEFAKLLTAGDGVKTLGDNLRITSANDGLRTLVGYGSALVQGYWYALSDDGGSMMGLQHEAAGGQPRVDRVVLRLDLSTDVRRPVLAIAQGVPGANPQPPALTRNGTMWELSLARVRVAVGAALLTDEDITDERADAEVCGTLDEALRLARENATAQATADAARVAAAAAQATADEALPAADYTAADVLNKLKTVDGAGSGLDADLFKGNAVVALEDGGTGASVRTGSGGVIAKLFGEQLGIGAPAPTYFLAITGSFANVGHATAAQTLQAIIPNISYSTTAPTGMYVGQLWLKPV